MRARTLIIFLCLVGTSPVLAGPISNAVFSHLNVEDGLSQGTVFDIAQDQEGCMWFATYDGLNRFDGYDFTVYRHSEVDSGSILGDIIRVLLIDSDGDLWAGTNKGISRYSRETDSFVNYPVEGDNIQFCYLLELEKGRILAKYSGALVICEKSSGKFDEVLSYKGITGSDIKILLSPHGSYIVSSAGMVESFDAESGKRELVCPEKVAGVRQTALSEDGALYIVSEGEGFCKVDLQTGRMTHFPCDTEPPRGLSTRHARCLCIGRDGKVWIGTASGLFMYEPTTGAFSSFKPDSQQPESLSHGSVRSVFCDNQGGIWSGTFFGGVNYYHAARNHFHTLRFESSDREVVGCLAFDETDGTLWAGTNREGVIHYDSKFRSYEKIKVPGPPGEVENNDIKVIAFGRNSKVYIGAEISGLNVYDRRSGTVRHIDSKDMFTSVQTMIEDGRGGYLLGTNQGLFHFSPSTESLRCIRPSRQILCLFRDSSGALWIGGDDALCKCWPGTDQEGRVTIVRLTEIGDVSMAQDINEAGGLVWIATRDGLYRYDRSCEQLSAVSLDAGASRSYKAIEEDLSGRLWISMEGGLYCYDPNTASGRLYSRKEGLKNNGFTIGTRLRMKDGFLYFGGNDGITVFNPSELSPLGYTPDPRIVSVSVSDRSVPFRPGGVIDIYHPDKGVSIKFSTPDYIAWGGNRFEYILEGVDQNWHESDPSRTASYYNLRRGRYEFRLRCFNGDGVPCGHPATLTVRIHPPWYGTTAFHLLLIVASLVLLLFVVMRIFRKQQRMNRQEIVRIRQEAAREIEELRIRAFLNSGSSSPIRPEDFEFLRKSLSVVHDHLSDPAFSIDVFAKEMCLSRTKLFMKMKEVTGSSALEFIKKVRLDEACALLKSEHLTVAEVSYRVGYASPAYFATDFKKQTGQTPTEYLNNH